MDGGGGATSRVLVIDDSLIVVSLLEAELASVGHEVRTALDGASGISVAEQWSPDVVLCDLNMPGLSGFEVVDALKQRAPMTPVLIFTDSDDLRCAVDAMQRGAWGYVVKGQGAEALLSELARALVHRRVMERNHQLESANLRYQRELEQMVEAKTKEIARLEAERTQAERLAAMGSFVAGVAHEVNNPLAVIKANTNYLAAELAEASTVGDEAKTALAEIQTCASRIQTIVAGLKRFSWAGTTSEQCAVTPALEEVKLLCRARVSEAVSCRWRVDPAASTVAMPHGDLVMVLSNLCINAAHAIEATGRPGVVAIEVAREGGQVAISVTDNGTGIPPELRTRIFDPFFTTKPPGKGSGLGLALVRQVVKNAQGTLHLDSEVGRGTTMRICVPGEASQASAPPATEAAVTS
ncbi:MAG: response regulator [Myxococcaceae bacterium]|nr:response regulator [Myxococcaceae bacterium]